MKFTIKAKIAIVGPVQEKGTFSFREVILEQYGAQKTLIYALQASGDRINAITPEMVGESIEAQFYINSREYNGRYYTNLSLAGVVASDVAAPTPVEPAAVAPPAVPDETLPF
jgi:hypothetical protein